MMPDDFAEAPEDHLYAEGMRYDLKQDSSPAAASLARASFQQAATMGHQGAVRALAHLIYEGRGGPRNKEHALLLLWSAVKHGELSALEDLADLLGTYAEELTLPSESSAAMDVSDALDLVVIKLARVSNYMGHLARAQISPPFM
jgi:TPR repeat protein